MKVVKCPNCGLMLKTKGKKYFRCYRCQVALDIDKCLVKEIEDKRWRRAKDTDKLIIITE